MFWLVFVMITFVNIIVGSISSIIQLSVKPAPYRSISALDFFVPRKISYNPNVDLVDDQQEGLGVFFPSQKSYSQDEQKSYRRLERSLMGIPGVFIYYRGFSALSDESGVVIFPCRESDYVLYVVITQKIEMVRVNSQVPTALFVSPDENSSWYKLTANRSEETFTSAWKAQKIQTPENRKIPNNALIVIASPESLYFDSQPRISTLSENFLLPPLYALRTLTRGVNSIIAMDTLLYNAPLMKASYISTTPEGFVQDCQKIVPQATGGSYSPI